MVVDRMQLPDKSASDSLLAAADLRNFVCTEDPAKDPVAKDWTRYQYAGNDFTAVATDKVFVLHVFVDDPNSNWGNVPWYRLNKTDMMSRAADGCEWIKDRAPSAANLNFSNQGNPATFHYYDAKVDSLIPNDADGGTNWCEAAAADIGFTDSDGDGTLIDEMLDAALYYHPEYRRALVMFHPYSSGRSYASKSRSRVVVFPFDNWDGLNTPKEVFAHEMLHLFGATDEYEEDGECPNYQCDEGVEHKWLEVWYTNANCEACADDPARCIMRISNPILPVIICRHTDGHIGWGDADDDGAEDFFDSRPISDWFCGPADPVVADDWFNCGAKGWTPHGHIDQMQYQVGDAIDPAGWLGLSPYDGTFDEFEEYCSFLVDLENEGWNTVWVRAHNSDGQWQHDGYIESFRIYRDSTGPGAPTVKATPNSDPDKWYDSTDITVTWTKPYDRSGVAGFSRLIDTWPTSPVDEVNLGLGTSTSFTATMTANYYAHVKAVDGLGNWGDQKDFRIRVDLTAPQAPVITAADHIAGAWSKDNSVDFSFAATDTGAGIYNYATALDQSPTTVLTSDPVYPGNRTVYPQDGIRWFHVAARDNAGNWGPTSHFELRIETTPPQAPLVDHSDPAPGAGWYAATSVTFTWPEPVTPPGIAGYSYVMAPGGIPQTPDTVVDTLATSLTFTGLASGTHICAVRAVDGAGNWSQGGWKPIKLDTTPPDTVQTLHTTSHGQALGQIHPVQSADSTVDISFNSARDAHSGTAQYAVLWTQTATATPTATYANSLGPDTHYTSPELTTGNWYAHVRAQDQVGNWSQTVHLGPICIDVTPPGTPPFLMATAGNGLVDLMWVPPGDTDITHYIIYCSNDPDLLGTAIESAWTGIQYQHSGLVNGDTYYYRVAAVDAVGLVSTPSVQKSARPLYTSPDTGVVFNGLASLAAASNGGLRADGSGGYTMHGTVTISAADHLIVNAGDRLLAVDRTGTDLLVVGGGFDVYGTDGNEAEFGAAGGQAGAWGGIHINPSQSSISYAEIRDGVTNLWCRGSDVTIDHCQILNASETGLDLEVMPDGTWSVDHCGIHGCGGFGLKVFAHPNSNCTLTNNDVSGNQFGIYWDTVQTGEPPLLLDIAENLVWNNTQDGIRCGYGGATTLIRDNDVYANNRGIVLEFEGMSATAPVIRDNDVRTNQYAGIYVSDLAHPDVLGNKIVGNRNAGVYCANEGFPTLRDNTITGSQVGVHVANLYTAPDLGTYPAAPGHNRLDNHAVYIQNLSPGPLAAEVNYWGAAQANPATVCVGPVTFNPVWNLTNAAPAITMHEPAGAVVASDHATISWDAGDNDPGDTVVVSLSCQTDPGGIDRAGIPGAGALTDEPGIQSFLWDVTDMAPGIYEIVATCSDGTTETAAVAAGTVQVIRPLLDAGPDSTALTLVRGESTVLTVTLTNNGEAAVTATLGEDDGAGGDVPWLDVSGTPVSLGAGGDTADVAVTVDATDLADDVYRGQITVTCDDPGVPLRFLDVELAVTHPEFAAAQDSVAFAPVAAGMGRQVIFNTWNPGTSTLTVEDPDGLAEPFTAVWLDGLTAEPGDSLRLQITGLSSIRGTFRDTVLIGTDDPLLPVARLGVRLDVHGPGLELSAPGHDFGPVAVGDSLDWELVLRNVGEDTLTVSGIAGTDPGFLPMLPGQMWVGSLDSVSVVVRFKPQAAEAAGGGLILAHDDAGGPTTVTLAGTGRTGAATFGGGLLDFGAVDLGDTTRMSSWLRNLGDEPFILESAAVDSPFVLLFDDFPRSVAAGDSVDLPIDFGPMGSGTIEGSLRATVSGGGAGTPAISLQGEGLLPGLTWDPEELDLGRVAVGAVKDTFLVLRNPGEGAVEMDRMFAIGSDYETVNLDFPAEIPGGDSLVVPVRFTPGAYGSRPDTLIVTTPWEFLNDGIIPLGGRGSAAALALEHTHHHFFAVEIGDTHFWALPVFNTGDIAAEIMVPPLPAPFGPPDTVFVVVPADGGVEIPICCAPASLGAWTDSVSVFTGSSPSLVGRVILTAEGARAILDPPGPKLTVDVFEDSTATADLVITNLGNYGLGYAVFGDGITWAGIPEPFGMVRPDSFAVVTVELSSAGRTPGVYTGQLLLLTSDAAAESTVIDLVMRVPRMRYAIHDAGDIHLTIGDEGAIGVFDSEQNESYGVGLQWPPGSPSHLVHGSLWVADGPGRLSDASFDYDFAVEPGQEIRIAGSDTQRTWCAYTDALAARPLGVRVAQSTLALADDGKDDFVILDFALTSAEPLAAVYVGMFLEPDIGNFLHNAGGYLADVFAGEMYAADGSSPVHVGMVAMSTISPCALRMIHNPTHIWPTADIPDTAAWGFLTSGQFDTTVPSPDDYSMVMAVGPVDLSPDEPVHVPFGVAAGGGQAEFRSAAAAARAVFDGVSGAGDGAGELPARFALGRPYPNPFNPMLTIPVAVPAGGGRVTLEIFDLRGRLVATAWDAPLDPGETRVVWRGRDDRGRPTASGVYFVRMRAGDVTGIRKVVLVR